MEIDFSQNDVKSRWISAEWLKLQRQCKVRLHRWVAPHRCHNGSCSKLCSCSEGHIKKSKLAHMKNGMSLSIDNRVFFNSSHYELTWSECVRTRRLRLCLARCLWPLAAGWRAWVEEEEEAQGKAKAREGRRRCRCWRGFWRAACTCASWAPGGPWWGWTTGCSRLLGKQRQRSWVATGWKRGGGRRWNPAGAQTCLTTVDDGVCRIVCVRIVVIWGGGEGEMTKRTRRHTWKHSEVKKMQISSEQQN